MYDFQTYYEDNNTTVLCGKIIKLYDIEVPKRNLKHLIITLDTGRRTFPKVFFSDKMIKSIREKLCEGQVISVSGCIQHSNLPQKGQVYAVWGTSLEIENPCDPVLYRNEFYLSGTVHRVELHSPRKTVAFIRTNCDGHKSLVPVTIFNEIDRPVNLEPGDRFRGCGVIQTGKKTRGDKNEFYEIYVAKTYI